MTVKWHILHKQCAWGLGEGVTNASYKKHHVTNCYMRPKNGGAVVHSYDMVRKLPIPKYTGVVGQTASHKDLCSIQQYLVRELVVQTP
jgi:hypothetical protein